MRPIVCSSFVSLDGVINHMERWHFDYVDAADHLDVPGSGRPPEDVARDALRLTKLEQTMGRTWDSDLQAGAWWSSGNWD